ncbi:MAG: TolC family protein, partial [Bacteroidota bacterium]|nr:TolC family protein [Bacteroidota bacterium]
MKLKYIYVVLMMFPVSLVGQESNNNLTLQDVVEIAKKQSPDALLAQHSFRSSYWEYRTFVATYRPKMNLSLTTPNLSKSISSIQQDDGSFSFRSSHYTKWSGGVSLSQKIGPTGGEVFINSNLQRMDLYSDSTITSFMTTPINIGFSQPLFDFNRYKWDKKIEPLKYKEAKQEYLEKMEQVSITAIDYFFNLLQAQIKYDIDKINLANNDTLFKITQGRYNIGTIAENELLQMELRYLNSQSDLRESELNLENREFYLKSFLRIPEDTDINLIPPVKVPDMEIDVVKAKSEAESNRSDVMSFERKLLEARRSVNRAKKEG